VTKKLGSELGRSGGEEGRRRTSATESPAGQSRVKVSSKKRSGGRDQTDATAPNFSPNTSIDNADNNQGEESGGPVKSNKIFNPETPFEVGGMSHEPPKAEDYGWPRDSIATVGLDGCIRNIRINSQVSSKSLLNYTKVFVD